MQVNIHALRQCAPPAVRGGSSPAPARETAPTGPDFRAVLQQTVDSADPALRFSRHAQERLASRHIELTPAEIDRLEQATDKAAAKGARDALMMLDDLSLIVSVRNRTVVTAMARDGSDDQVFTNIDTAVMVGPASAAGDQ